MTIQERLSEYLKTKSLTNRDFERICNLSNGTAARIRETTRKSTFDRIANTCDLNIDWLRKGEGNMISQVPQKGNYLSPESIYAEDSEVMIGDAILAERVKSLEVLVAEKDERIAELKERIEELKRQK